MSVSTAMAIIGILRFYSHMKTVLAPHKVFLKLFSFKGIVGLTLVQGVSLHFQKLIKKETKTDPAKHRSSSTFSTPLVLLK